MIPEQERMIICGYDLDGWDIDNYSEEACDGVVYATYHDKLTGLKLCRDFHADFVNHHYTNIPEELSGNGFYTKLLVQEVRILLFYGYKRIEVFADKSRNDVGYIIAARFGFDGEFKGHKVSDLVNNKGLVYWKSNGGAFSATLELDTKSEQFKSFVQFVCSKGFVVEKCALSKVDRMRLCGFGVIPNWDEKFYSESMDETGEIECEYYVPNDNDVTGGDFIIKRSISENKLVCNRSFYLPENLRGSFGVKLLLQEVSILQKYGFKKIKTYASRFNDDIGYLLWPKMGFDGKVVCDDDGAVSEYECGDNIPHNLCLLLVSEYIQLFGYNSWIENGCGHYCWFDLQPDSYSMKALHNYAQNKGVL